MKTFQSAAPEKDTYRNNGQDSLVSVPAQCTGHTARTSFPMPVQRKSGSGNLPSGLKAGIENHSGLTMDDVRVHYNSNKPAQLRALAYAQGTDIYVGRGQEKYLPHEAWHVVQQKQGRVQPTIRLNEDVPANDDKRLEREADVMGAKVIQRVAVVQRGQNPIDESLGQKFKYGLIKGTYVPKTNTADMHVEHKTEGNDFKLVDVYYAFAFVYKKMQEQKSINGQEGELIWNPQGAAVIKMVVELLGETLGDPELTGLAKVYKEVRKNSPPEKQDENVISKGIVPEHLQYLQSIRGAKGVEMRAVIPGNNTEKNFDSDMLQDTSEGRSRFQDYGAALKEQTPISLRIKIKQAQLGMLIETLKKMR
jgi:hypothetical protein